MFLRQSTTKTIRMGPALDKTDGVTEETALAPTVELSKNNGAFAARNSATAITHDSNGWYAVEVNATDTNTVGRFVAKFDDAATHLPVWHEFWVLEEAVYDGLFAASASAIEDIKAKTDALPTDPADQSLVIAATDTILWRLPAALIGGRMDASVGANAAGVDLSATMKASVKTEVVNALNVDTYAEPGQGAPAATQTIRAMIGYLYKGWRNKKTQTASQHSLLNDAGAVVDQKAATSFDGTTFTQDEIVSGP